MARLGSKFDATNVTPNQRGVIPDGYYTAVITDSEMRATKSATGAYLQLSVQIIEGPFRGRHLIDRLNLENPNPQAVEIAEATLSSICHAIGVMRVEDSVQLHGKRMTIDVITEPARDLYPPQNRINNYLPFTGTERPPSIVNPPRERTQPATRGNGAGMSSSTRKPWETPRSGSSVDDDEIPFVSCSFDIDMPLHRKPVVA